MYCDEGFRPDGAEFLDFSGLEGTTCYCDPESEIMIGESLREVPLDGLHWIDSGDYHYLTLFFLERIKEPFVLVLFDNHSDDQACAFDAGCLSCGSWVERARETLPLMRDVHWVREDEVPAVPDGLPVYISLDKDILSEEYYRTDWDQGNMTLPGLKSVIGEIFRTRRVLGTDVCGGLTVSKGAHAGDLALNLKTDVDLQDFLLKSFRDRL